MDIMTSIKSRRTVRKFNQTPIAEEIIIDIIDGARLAPYPANVQPLKFAFVNTPELCEKVFPNTKWAGYLTDGTPKEGECPMAYIFILGDRKIKENGDFKCENGIAGSFIVLGAESYSLGACWMGAINRENISKILSLPENLELLDLVALGYPSQKSRAVEMTDSVKYYLDENGTLNVPKRSIDEVIYKI